jgi:hypothetical protein
MPKVRMMPGTFLLCTIIDVYLLDKFSAAHIDPAVLDYVEDSREDLLAGPHQ